MGNQTATSGGLVDVSTYSTYLMSSRPQSEDLTSQQPSDILSYTRSQYLESGNNLTIEQFAKLAAAEVLELSGNTELANQLYMEVAQEVYISMGNSVDDFVTIDGQVFSLGSLIENKLIESTQLASEKVSKLDLKDPEQFSKFSVYINANLTVEERKSILAIKEKYETGTVGSTANSQMTAEISEVYIAAMERINSEAVQSGMEPVFSEGFILDFKEVQSIDNGAHYGAVLVATFNLLEAINSGDETKISQAYADLDNAKRFLDIFKQAQQAALSN